MLTLFHFAKQEKMEHTVLCNIEDLHHTAVTCSRQGRP